MVIIISHFYHQCYNELICQRDVKHRPNTTINQHTRHQIQNVNINITSNQITHIFIPQQQKPNIQTLIYYAHSNTLPTQHEVQSF